MTGYHTRWARPQDASDDPERFAIRGALAFGKALYDIRTALAQAGVSLIQMRVWPRRRAVIRPHGRTFIG